MNNTKVFLKDERVFEKIITASDLKKDDIVIEIGSGDGRLTKRISPYVSKVYAIEIDTNLFDSSRTMLEDLKNVEFINGDALEIDFPKEANKIISNLPYAISSPITDKIIYFLNGKKGSLAVLMYQLEFGERMLAFPGIRDYSMISVFTQYTSKIELISRVSKNAFRPRPAVESIILRIKPKNIEINENFLEFARLLFQHKKKNLYSALMDSRGKLNVKSKEELREKLQEFKEKDKLKQKVFYLEISELEDIYDEMLRIGICKRK
ncbi:MAG: 16S rRNA (adenine(1518)-N(6)/adenine(1519)-N(6))-dimethyltransferase RsmA [Candidatus Parvarchaeota archaeon]|jgi:16S rRNA (adenine1518-N6/adenine1519-N6)-dimethyltransferase|nr:16S rRNA (adenine(1518)-N(6)/adenine(1519)-N(6))-dimethyltransferase RsmA [Candidatus Parvarchaeota archaeon]MCL5106823.1 16S rRNA (adenine(1518)-N(6)/adenine(1519)-N(6))-dimethyltransferase RsmA [Candidatus Parvarchaeota archaeon]